MRNGLCDDEADRYQLVHWPQAWAGMFVLVLGTLVYVLDRPADAAPFFSAINIAHWTPGTFGALGASLPTFSHVLAFSLLTAACFGGTRSTGLAACFSWCAIDTAFELGQIPALASRIDDLAPGWFDSIPVLSGIRSYFLAGTFDTADLVSILFGATAAYLLIWSTARHGDRT